MRSPLKPTVITVMLAGGDRESVSPEAMRSAEDVTDRLLLINTGSSADKTIDWAIANYLDEGYVIVSDYPGKYESCSSGRNFCLSEAQNLGDWALLLDTDERLHNLEGVREFLETTDATVVMVPDETNFYLKPKFFRLPATGLWHGDPHEAWVMSGNGREVRIPTKTYFSEVPKTKEEQDARMRSIAKTIDAKPRPLSPRDLYYLADALNYCGEQDRAIELFLQCNRESQWDEEQHWSLFRAALEEMNQGNLRRCVEILQCQETYAIPETLWLRSLAEYRLGWFAAAIQDATICTELGKVQRRLPRRCFRHTMAWYDAPYDVLRWAFKAIGEEETANKFDEIFERELKERMALSGN